MQILTRRNLWPAFQKRDCIWVHFSTDISSFFVVCTVIIVIAQIHNSLRKCQICCNMFIFLICFSFDVFSIFLIMILAHLGGVCQLTGALLVIIDFDMIGLAHTKWYTNSASWRFFACLKTNEKQSILYIHLYDYWFCKKYCSISINEPDAFASSTLL